MEERLELKIAYKHMGSTPSISEKINDKAAKLKKFFDGKIHVEWTCSVEAGIHHSEVTVTGDHGTFNASDSDDNLYKTFDGVIAKLEKQITKKKEILKEKIHRRG